MSEPLPDGWTGDDARIRRIFAFESFPRAIAFMVEVSYHCEAKDHHPEWMNVYDRIAVELTTHDVGRVTDKDRELALHMNAVWARSYAV